MYGGAFIPSSKISYGLSGNVLFDSFEYGQNFLILHNNTQLHKQLYHQFLQHFSSNGSTNLYVAAKRNPFDTSFETRNIYFDKLNAEFLNKLKAEIKKCATEAHKKAKSLLLICDWAGANINSRNAGGGEIPRRKNDWRGRNKRPNRRNCRRLCYRHFSAVSRRHN